MAAFNEAQLLAGLESAVGRLIVEKRWNPYGDCRAELHLALREVPLTRWREAIKPEVVAEHLWRLTDRESDILINRIDLKQTFWKALRKPVTV
jgi:hypothetical protein